MPLSCLQESRPGKFLAGDKVTHGDLAVFCNLSVLQSGWMDGKAHCLCMMQFYFSSFSSTT